MDLLNDVAYEDLLRLASSGRIAYGAASPACCEYSRLKLRNDDGPRALRSPEHLSGLPGLNMDEAFNVLVHCVLQGTSLCFYSILAQGLSFVRLHFSFLSAQPTVCFWTSVAGIDTDQLRFLVMQILSEFHVFSV